MRDPNSKPLAALYESFGGREACYKLSTGFYARVAHDPILRPLFPSTFKCAIEEFAAFLAQFLGGPPEHFQRRWWLSLRESHARFKIGPNERSAWLKVMNTTLDEEVAEPHRSSLRKLFEHASAYVANQPFTRLDNDRWNVHLALENAIASIRQGRSESIEAPPLKDFLANNPAIHAHLLAIMMQTGAGLQHIERAIAHDPTLAKIRHRYDRTLLIEAASAGRLALVELLLAQGADPNNDGARSPLYCLANESKHVDAPKIVRTLVAHGADVNKGTTTPLHMAARQGSTAVAEALLDCEAHIDPLDPSGDTPLRRAVNCNRYDVAALLLVRGADPHCPGSKGLTPVTAARNERFRQLLNGYNKKALP